MPSKNKKQSSSSNDVSGSISLDPDLSAGGICGTGAHMTDSMQASGLDTVSRTQSGATKTLGSKNYDPKPGIPLVDGVEDLTGIKKDALYGPNRT